MQMLHPARAQKSKPNKKTMSNKEPKREELNIHSHTIIHS
uniref:Uncharacterized protein n=1 Tax=Rhizophora mucronata TaxID=61149 RepID=A0A2P2PGM2_RHIMU